VDASYRLPPTAGLAGYVLKATPSTCGLPDEIASGHCVALSRPKELADLLESYTARQPTRGELTGAVDRSGRASLVLA
jgi:hypothetical protein